MLREHHEFQDIARAYDGLAAPPSRPTAAMELALMRDFEVRGPSLEDVFDRFVRSCTGRQATKAQRLEALDVELRLAPEQATWGGTLAISVPVFAACGVCGGTGRDWRYLCVGCLGRGIVVDEAAIHCRLPARIVDGAVAVVPLTALGAPDQALRLRFRISA